ncbi:MAG: 4-hydroxy-3-methylbut-2-enyl diphosphate reductase [Geminicoccaceae bacterium]|nr:4-hydroxy-3-methylbut-2-enyl diphosphate reductase [Geminicoccaceae bacterium]
MLLASPRGFCAGVERAIQIVERALQEHGAPVYVRHEIVHNRHVVSDLESKGAIFVDELDEVPEDALVVFSAHGVPKSVPREAARRRLLYADATCPLVSKVHREVERHHREGRTIILIGHAGHPEVEGTMGQVAEGSVLLVETVDDVARVEVPDPHRLAFATQTTLSVQDTAAIVAALRERFPGIRGPRNEDICYATTNRQQAISSIAGRCQLVLVVGAPNSSNSVRLVEIARNSGCPRALLIQDARELDIGMLDGVATVGISAGASAPESLVQGLIAALRERFDVEVEPFELVRENVTFRAPPTPRRTAAGIS